MKKIFLSALTLSFAGWIIFISCKKEYSCEGCEEKNQPPTAVAGPDQVITLPTDSVSLDGSASNDPDGTISEWLWTKISGPASFNIINAATAKTVVKNLTAGSYQFELKVTDNGGLSAKDTITLTVDATQTTNHPPIANAGTDQTITLPTNTVNLDGIGSTDPDNNITSYAWTKISGPSSFSITNANAVQTQISNLVAGVYQVELKVMDNGGLSAKDTMTVTVDSTQTTNHPPIANAGTDQTITLPTNTVNLDGSGSTDPDNNITSYSWTKIFGPSSFSIANASGIQTQIQNLFEGIYQFELKVTDAGGLSDMDTVQVKVNSLVIQPCIPGALIQTICDNTMRPQVCAQLIPIGTLSGGPGRVEVAFAGNKLVYYNYYIDILDIYDPTLHTWSTADQNLSQPSLTTSPTVVGVGNKVLFAGGEIGQLLPSDVVDIYDVSTNTWTVSHLSTPGMFFPTATCGNKVFFAGGFVNAANNVDIYNVTTDSWSTASLSTSLYGITAAFSGNNKVYFTGVNGPLVNQASGLIEIYDNATNSWSTSTMQLPRINHAGVAVNDILYMAGGNNDYPYYPNNPTICSVETLNTISGDRTSMNLFSHAAWQNYYGQNAVLKDNKIIFLRQQGGANANKFDIYDIQSNTWSTGVLPQPIPEGASAISVNNIIYIAGGTQNNKVWKLEF